MRFFVTGASGFIGGSFAAEAIRRGHQVRGLVRSPEKANAVRAFGIDPVLGTLAEHTLLADEARGADVVVNAASSDDRGAVDAILAALGGSGKAFLHTSGSSIVADEAKGEPTETVVDEDHIPAPAAGKAARVALDRAILSATGVRSIVLCNSLIFGDALGPKARSVQLPLLIDYARESGQPITSAGVSIAGRRFTSRMWSTSICWRLRKRRPERSRSWKAAKPHSEKWRPPSPTPWGLACPCR